MKRQIFAAILLSLVLLWGQPLRSQGNDPESLVTPPKKPIVILTIDYGDGAQKRFPEIPWRDKMTVADALNWANKHAHGIDFKSRGKGATQLVSQIDDLKNGKHGDKNWIFRVNGQLADRSCGIFGLKRGDRVLWRFERYQ